MIRMRVRKHLALCLRVLLLALLLAWSASAEQIRIGEVRGNDVSAGELATVRSLIESQLMQQAGVVVVGEDARGPVSTLEAEVNLWDDSLILIMRLDRPDGPSVSRNSRAVRMGEVDVAVSDLVSEVLWAAAVVDDPADERYDAGEYGQEPPPLKRGRTTVSGHLGPAWGLGDALGTRSTLYDFGLGFGWDFRRSLIELRSDFLVGANDQDVFGFIGTLGWDYVWLDGRSVAVYSGLEGGIGYLREEVGGTRESRTGFLFGFSTGLLLVREANVNIDFRLRLRVLSERMNGEVPVIGGIGLGLRF